MNESDIATVVYSELLKVAGGAAVILAALSAFLGRIWINRIAGREAHARDERLTSLRAEFENQNAALRSALDARLQRTVLVDRVQFEHEYTIYKEVWACLYSLRQATLRLRPVMDYVDPNESKEDRIRNRIRAFAEPFHAYRDTIEKSKPFYSEHVYTALSSVLDKCHNEVIDFEYSERSSKEYWAEAAKTTKISLKR